MIRWLTLLLVLSLVALGQARATTTHYISFNSGLNSNNGTSTATPWKTAPGMQTPPGCAGGNPAYTPVAGDVFIFKGGDTWPAACFSWNIPTAGASGNPIYYGACGGQSTAPAACAGATWPTSGWTRPIFNLTQSVPTGVSIGSGFTSQAVITSMVGFITFDDIEIVNQGIAYAAGQSAQVGLAAAIDAFGSGGSAHCGDVQGILVSNMFIHAFVSSENFPSLTGWGGYDAGGLAGCHVIMDHTTIDDSTGFAFNQNGVKVNTSIGGSCRNCQEIKFSKFDHVVSGSFTVPNTHDSEFTGIDQTAWYAALGAPGFAMSASVAPHTQVIENDFNGSSGTYNVWNNWIHDNPHSGVTIYECDQTNIYNNVMVNNSNNNILLSACSSLGASAVANVYNNTVDCTNGIACFATDSKGTLPGKVDYYNNLWITNGTAVSFASPITTPHSLNNYTMGTAEANNPSNGFTQANKYKGSASNTNVKNQGTNLTTTSGAIPGCNAVGATLCSDTQGASWYGGTIQARPGGAVAWDRGAYVLAALTSPNATLTPSSMTFSTNRTTTSAPQTATYTNTSSSTVVVSSVTVAGAFAQTNDCGGTSFSLGGGLSCHFFITFNPSTTGVFSGSLSVSSNAASSPNITTLSGTGTAPIISLSPASYAFGNVVINVPTVSTNFALSNTGDGPLAVHLSTGGADAAFFSVNSACPATLNAGLSCIVQAIFTPLTITSYSGTLVETDPIATGSPTTNALTGSGVAVPLPAPVGLVPWIL